MFRKADKTDIPKLIDLISQLVYRIDTEKLYENLIQYQDQAWVLESGGEILGCLAFHILQQFHSTEKHMRIVSLIVDEKHRRKGIGKDFLREAERVAVEKGCSVIELTSAAYRISSGAHDFYKQQGYHAEGKKVYFRKELS